MLILLFFLLEVFLGITCLRIIGFFPTLFLYFVPTLLAWPLFAFQNQMIWMQFQRQLALGRTPDKQLLHLVAKFAGTVLFLIPSLVCRVVAIVLIFPLTRMLLVFLAKPWIARKVAQGSFRVFNGANGFGHAGPFSFRYGQYRGNADDGPQERDAKVIDVEALHLPPGPTKPLK